MGDHQILEIIKWSSEFYAEFNEILGKITMFVKCVSGSEDQEILIRLGL